LPPICSIIDKSFVSSITKSDFYIWGRKIPHTKTIVIIRIRIHMAFIIPSLTPSMKPRVALSNSLSKLFINLLYIIIKVDFQLIGICARLFHYPKHPNPLLFGGQIVLCVVRAIYFLLSHKRHQVFGSGV